MRRFPSIAHSCLFAVILTLWGTAHGRPSPLSDTFTYQGQLKQNGAPATGTHHLRFQLWDAFSGGSQVGGDLNFPALAVNDGLFTVALDFGPSVFINGDARWLQVQVITNGGASITTLTPRQPLTATPYSLQTRGIFVNGNESFVGIGRTSPVNGNELFGLGAATSNFTGMFIRSDATGEPFYGYSAGTDVDAYTYYDGDDDAWRVNVGGSDRLTIDAATGWIGIGTMQPFAPLEVNQSSAYTLLVQNPDGNTAIAGWSLDDTGSTVGVAGYNESSSGKGVLGIGQATGGTNYGVYGLCNSSSGYDFYAGGVGINYGSPSSIRWKRDIQSIPDPLGLLSQIRGVYFDWDAEHGGHHDVGMIAEEVGKVLPEIVSYEENGIDAIGMDYSKLTPLLVEAVKAMRMEKDAQVEQLRNERDAQQAIIDQLLKRVEALERQSALNGARIP